MKPVVIIAIVAVAMIGVMVPSVFAEDKDSEKYFPHYFKNSEDAENVIVSNRGPHVGTVSLQNVEVIDKDLCTHLFAYIYRGLSYTTN